MQSHIKKEMKKQYQIYLKDCFKSGDIPVSYDNFVLGYIKRKIAKQ